MNLFFTIVLLIMIPHQVQALSQEKKEVFFSLTDIVSGKNISDSDLPQEPYILHFWSSWCTSCEKSHENMYILGQKYPIVGIVIQDDEEIIKKWSENHAHPYLYILDDKEANLALDLNIPFAPCTMLVDGHGVIIRTHIGILEDPYKFVYQ